MQRFKNVLLVANLDAFSDVAFHRACELAKSNQSKLTILEVVEKIPANIDLSDFDISLEEVEYRLVSAHRTRLEELVSAMNSNLHIDAEVMVGTPHIEVIRRVIQDGFDVVIKSADDAYRISGQDLNLLRKCPCPVWLVGSESQKGYKRIVASLDADDSYEGEERETRLRLNYQILKFATAIALAESAELHLVHAWRAVGESALRGGFLTRSEKDAANYANRVEQIHKDNLNHLLENFAKDSAKDSIDYIEPQIHLLKGWPNKVIPSYINDNNIELVVMGTVCRTGISGFFVGNTAESIFSQTCCSILAVKPEGFLSPVTKRIR